MSVLDEPVRTKFSNKGGNARFDYGVSAMQGYREQMEDAHVAIVNFDAPPATSFFAVYDGHGGDLAYKNDVSLEARYQAVTAFPEVRSVEITAGTEFLVIACDGIW
ncbi:hypothetical protein PR202_ga19780 [Eleusine coracana subsp. coracana]|uniref:protein-serine/threonine phosphatase n=1 Tax=Eleusine coracana subsp. coracana TaxID=191504 RepID=A0AAV5CWQ0_ELECO|nr:hypothetical protein PR202_ga19780 [Eleusine coracana subsp. coracana]